MKLLKKLAIAACTMTFMVCNLAFAKFVVLDDVHFDKQHSAKNYKIVSVDNGIPTEIRLKAGNYGYTRMTVKQNKKLVYITDLLTEDNIHHMQRVQDQDSGRIFYLLSQFRHATAFGYDPVKGTWQEYINSKNYYAGYDKPHANLIVNKDNELELSFFVFGDGVPNHIYQFFWDNKANWFGYRDLGYYVFKDGKNHKV